MLCRHVQAWTTCNADVSVQLNASLCVNFGVASRDILLRNYPCVFHNFGDRNSFVNIPVQHFPDKVNARLGERDKGHSEGVVEDFINVVKWVFLVDDGVEKNSQCPDILLLASVSFALKDFWCSII
jgi:hypothetical protein